MIITSFIETICFWLINKSSRKRSCEWQHVTTNISTWIHHTEQKVIYYPQPGHSHPFFFVCSVLKDCRGFIYIAICIAKREYITSGIIQNGGYGKTFCVAVACATFTALCYMRNGRFISDKTSIVKILFENYHDILKCLIITGEWYSTAIGGLVGKMYIKIWRKKKGFLCF